MPPIMIRKQFGYAISVTKGSRRIIACSKANWGTMREGSFIAIAGSSIFHRVLTKKQGTIFSAQIKNKSSHFG